MNRSRWKPPANLSGPVPEKVLRVKDFAEYDAISLYIYGPIDSWGEYWGVSAAEVIGALRDITSSTIDVHLNSPGGDYFEGVAIHTALAAYRGTVNIHVDGMAASAASVIAMAGNTITMAHGAQMMIHDPTTISMGGAAQLRSDANLLDKIAGDISEFYAHRAGGDAATWRKAMAKETWYTAAEAVAAGLADKVAERPTGQRPEPEAEETASEAAAARAAYWIAAWARPGRDAAPAPEPAPAAPVVAGIDLAAAVRAGVRAAAAPSTVRTKEATQ